MKPQIKEWRVVSERVRGCFRVFGDNEQLARDFIEVRPRLVMLQGKEASVIKRGSNLVNDEIGPYRLEPRPFGMQGNDSTWTNEAYRNDDKLETVYETTNQ